MAPSSAGETFGPQPVSIGLMATTRCPAARKARAMAQVIQVFPTPVSVPVTSVMGGCSGAGCSSARRDGRGLGRGGRGEVMPERDG
jgi:hypothetical protein